jgi:PAS domain S-box-containing protein
MSFTTEQIALKLGRDKFNTLSEAVKSVQSLADLIFNNIAGFAIIIYDDELRYLYASGPAISESGYNANEMIGKTIEQVLPKESIEVLKPIYLKTLQNESSEFNHESDGKTYLTKFIPSKIADSSIGIILVQDITESQKINRDYKEMNDRFTLASKGSRDGIWDWIKIENRDCWFSDQFYSILGYKKNELTATFDQFLDLFHEEDRTKTMDQINKHFENNSNFDLYARLNTKKGYRWYRVLGQAKFDEEGNPIRMVGTITYKHELITNNRKLKRNSGLLESQKNQLQEIIHVASHDFKVPIQNLGGLLNLMDSSGFNEEQKEILERLKSNVAILQNTTDNLYEALSQNRDHDHLSTINVLEHVDDVITSMDENLISVEANIETLIDPDLEIYFSKFHFNSIVSNLIENSIKYRSLDKPLLIQISAQKHGETIILKFSDNGKGMDLTLMKDKMFRLFQQADSNSPGKGIGLFTVKSIVDRNNGSIHVESEPGQGTVFTIKLLNHE